VDRACTVLQLVQLGLAPFQTRWTMIHAPVHFLHAIRQLHPGASVVTCGCRGMCSKHGRMAMVLVPTIPLPLSCLGVTHLHKHHKVLEAFSKEAFDIPSGLSLTRQRSTTTTMRRWL